MFVRGVALRASTKLWRGVPGGCLYLCSGVYKVIYCFWAIFRPRGGSLKGRKIFGLKYKDDIEGIACFAFTNEIPATIKEMDLMSVEEDQATIPIAYTLWSFKKGAGKKIMKELQKYIKSKEQFESIITISPLTPVATHYHIRNGARLIKINPTTQNFEYKF